MASNHQNRQKTVMSHFICCTAAFDSACQWLQPSHQEGLANTGRRVPPDDDTYQQYVSILEQADRFKLWGQDFQLGSNRKESPISERDPDVISLLEKLEQELDIGTHWKLVSDQQELGQKSVNDSWQFLAINPSDGEDISLNRKVVQEIIDQLYEFSNNCQLKLELSDSSKVSGLQAGTKSHNIQKSQTSESSIHTDEVSDNSRPLVEFEYKQGLLGFQSQRDFDALSFRDLDSRTERSSDTFSVVGSELSSQTADVQREDISLTEVMNDIYLKVVIHNNRTYQQYSLENYIYFAPVDKDEITRLKEQHDILQLMFDDRLIFPPINQPRRILDCGCGTGSWATNVAISNPNCQVIAVDIYPYAEDEILENLYLQVDDLNLRFSFPNNHFDLTHSQLIASGINADRWPTYIRDMFRVTKPGGWCQIVEIYYQWQSDNGSLLESHALRRWSTHYFKAHETIKDLKIPLRFHSLLRDAGFIEIEQRMLPLYSCGWSKTPREKNNGLANQENVQQLLSSLALYPFTELLGMTLAEVQLLVSHARNEAMQPSFKAYLPLYVCIGRKPRR